MGGSAAVPAPRFVEAAGHRLRHLIVGDVGEAVVLVHGFGGRLENWAANQAAFAATGRTIAALDLPGHGESSLDVGTGSLDELAAAVLAYMDAVGIARAHMVGSSMGAALCLALTDRACERVRSLTLIGPAGIGQKINADFIRGYVAAGTRAELEPLLRLLYARPDSVTEELVQQVVAYKQRAGAAEALARIASNRYVATPSGRSLRAVVGTVPTMMIWGSDDRVIPAPTPSEFSRQGVAVHVLPGCGHMVHAEAAAAVNRLIDRFLRG